jgi:hypothetical protein
MTFPAFLLSVLIALFYGALYHLVRGGRGWRLLLYLGLSLMGFMAGHFIGVWRGWLLLMLGSINLGMGTVGSLIFLAGGDWLGRIEAKPESRV